MIKLLKLAQICLICIITNTIFGQTKWNIEPLFSPLFEKAKLKTIKYKSTDYVAIGFVYKNQFLDGQNVTFLSKQMQDTIISGRFYKSDNLAYIDGVWKQKNENGIIRTYGIFQVKNADDEFGFTIKPPKGKPLKIETKDVFLHQGFRNKYPAILTKQDHSTYLLTIYYIDSQDERDFYKSKMEIDKKLIEKNGFYDLNAFILYTTNITRYYNNGTTFIGRVENTIAEDNCVKSELREGKFTHTNGDKDVEELTKLPDDNFIYKVSYSERKPNNKIAQMEIIVNKSLIDKYGYWATEDYIYNTTNIKYTYKNKNVFEGEVKHTRDTINDNEIIINSQLTNGTLKYSTGELFNGDLSGQWFCGVPIDGKMKFSDGHIENGNWFIKYGITNELEELEETLSPSEKRELVKKIHNDNQYQFEIFKAEEAIIEGLYDSAKIAYTNALKFKIENEEYIISQINKIDSLILVAKEKKPFIKKYGEYWGNLVYSGNFTLGMNTDMVFDVLIRRSDGVKNMDEALNGWVSSLKEKGISTKGIGSSIKDCYNIESYKNGSQMIEIYTFNKSKYVSFVEKLARKNPDPTEQFKELQIVNQIKQMFNVRIFGADPLKNQLPILTFTNGKLSEIDYGFSDVNILGY